MSLQNRVLQGSDPFCPYAENRLNERLTAMGKFPRWVANPRAAPVAITCSRRLPECCFRGAAMS